MVDAAPNQMSTSLTAALTAPGEAMDIRRRGRVERPGASSAHRQSPPEFSLPANPFVKCILETSRFVGTQSAILGFHQADGGNGFGPGTAVG